MIAEAPPHTETLLAQALTAYRLGDKDEAETLYGAVLRLDPGNAHALHILGLLAHDRNDHEMAASLIGRSVLIHPHGRAQHNLGVVQQQMGQIDAAITTYRRALQLAPDYLEAAMNLLFAVDLHPYISPEQTLAEREAFAAAFCDPLTAMAAPHENDRDPERRLRVGYVSPDFRRHSAAMSVGWIASHDPSAVETYLYATDARRDEDTVAFSSAADVWCEVDGLNDAELARTIREDRIDILVDLAGYSHGGRPLLFAQKPAPVQITGWGYATGTGMAAMDYLVSDAVAVPTGSERWYRERILRLPCLLAYAPGPYPAMASTPPQERNGYRTYGCLGRAQKVNEATLALWARILREDPTSRLLLKSGQWEIKAQRDRVAQALWALGVPPTRIEVRGETDRLEHLATHNEIDVVLDPTPHGGGATTMDACLMGVPTVTLAGDLTPGRTAASILETIGYRGLVAQTPDEYVQWALLGTPRGGRQAIRDALLGSIICDPTRYARSVEDAYRTAWRHRCESQT